jgi:release factor glutamine methyltransferase
VTASAGELLVEGRAALAAAGIEGARAEARLLLEDATGLPRAVLLTAPSMPVSPAAAASYRASVHRRAAREPMAYVRGRAEFWSLDFLVVPGVLVPRADTETLIEVATRVFPDTHQPLRLLDIGVGSGCLLLTLLHLYPTARGVGTDTSLEALSLTARNAARLGLSERLELLPTSWAEGVSDPFDLVVSNPPYIPTAEIDRLQLEVSRFEPRFALDGGPDGLDAYRAILADLRRLLGQEGTALLEIGQGQEAALLPLAAARGLTPNLHRDLAAINRCLELRLAPLGN